MGFLNRIKGPLSIYIPKQERGKVKGENNNEDEDDSSPEEKEKKRQSAWTEIDFTRPGCPHDCLDDWLCYLARKNLALIENTHDLGYDGVWIRRQSVEFLFTCCEKLDLPPEVKFHAIILLDKYHVVYMEHMMDKVMENANIPLRERHRLWQEHIESRIQKQWALRTISAIQISSKVFSYIQTVTVAECVDILKRLGHVYKNEEVLASEIRVLEALDFNVNRYNPIDLLDTLLALLLIGSKTAIPQEACKQWHTHSLALMSLVFLDRDQMYRRLLDRAAGTKQYTPRVHLSRVQADGMLLASGCISAGAYFVEKSFRDAIDPPTVPQRLHEHTNAPANDYRDFALVIMESVSVDGEKAKRAKQRRRQTPPEQEQLSPGSVDGTQPFNMSNRV